MPDHGKMHEQSIRHAMTCWMRYIESLFISSLDYSNKCWNGMDNWIALGLDGCVGTSLLSCDHDPLDQEAFHLCM